MIILNCAQGSPEWDDARRGIPTASGMGNLITPKTGKPSSSADAYICELIAETACPDLSRGFDSFWMRRGLELEPEARRWYEFQFDCVVDEVGIILRDDRKAGASPDGLIGDDAGLEIKCPSPKMHVSYLMAGTLPDEYKAQVHGNLLISERQWWTFLSYCPGLEPLVVHVERDEFTERLGNILDEFIVRLDEYKARFLT